MPIGFRRYGEGAREGKIKVLKEEERKKRRKREVEDDSKLSDY